MVKAEFDEAGESLIYHSFVMQLILYSLVKEESSKFLVTEIGGEKTLTTVV
jgi:hypothetical protein